LNWEKVGREKRKAKAGQVGESRGREYGPHKKSVDRIFCLTPQRGGNADPRELIAR